MQGTASGRPCALLCAVIYRWAWTVRILSRLTVTLTPQLEALVPQKVDDGAYRTADEVIAGAQGEGIDWGIDE